ncbi:hypothetical protein C5E44_08605 [Nocardia nova]|uniref:hypothetical protein n=1 Tax=Nocardia nova TaxID=37330 RepID=UPI000CE9E2E8|nr:hypothetical protein C5E44_08605 [Nocardia nova]
MGTAVKYMIGLVESTGTARAADFDIEGIVDNLHALVDDWDFSIIDRPLFWGRHRQLPTVITVS